MRVADDGDHQPGVGLCRHAEMHRTRARDHARLIVVTRVDHREMGQRLADRGDDERQQRELRFRTTIGIQLGARFLEIGYVDLLDVGKVRDVALGRGHVLGDAAAHPDNLDLLVGAAVCCGRIAASVGQERVEVGMAQTTVGGGLYLGEIDAEIASARADCG